LDIFVLQSHGLPLPYLASISITFLVHLSPVGYLTIFQQRKDKEKVISTTDQWKIDLPLTSIREHLQVAGEMRRSFAGVSCVDLKLENAANLETAASGLGSLEIKMDTNIDAADFSQLDQNENFDDLVFPLPQSILSDLTPGKSYAWMLDFGDQPIVLSKSRLRRIQALLDPLRPNSLDPSHGIPFRDLVSWTDLLVCCLADNVYAVSKGIIDESFGRDA
jgi:hypothetical protein